MKRILSLTLLLMFISTTVFAALTATVTKKSVSKIRERHFNVTVNFVLNDSTATPTEVINKDLSYDYKSGQGKSQIINALEQKMKDAIDGYTESETLFDAAAFDNAISDMQTNLTTYLGG